MKGALLYSPIDMNNAFKDELSKYNWEESRVRACSHYLIET